VADLMPGPSGSYPQDLAAGGTLLFFRPAGLDAEPWVSDGTAAGTRLVRDIHPSGRSEPSAFTALAGGRVLFFARTPAEGREPWITDGTLAGTALVADVWPGPGDSVAASTPLAVVGSGRVALFAADEGVAGQELWRTDGTSAGTWRLTDIDPGPASSMPGEIVRTGARLLFAAQDQRVGREPWAMPLVATGDSLAAPIGAGCAGTGGRIPVLAGDGVPALGNAAFAAELDDARPGAGAALVLSAQRQTLQFGACSLYLALPGQVVPFVAGATGSGRVPLPIPAVPALRGLEIFLQGLVADPAGGFANLLAFSNALHLVLGD
jgi:ELWxxDGT repeat protein